MSSKPPLIRIGDITLETQYGTAQKANESGAGLPVLRMGNITEDGRIDLSDIKHVELQPEELLRHTVRRGDVLFNRTNSAELVGKTALWASDETYAFAGYLVRLRLAPDRCDPRYFAYVLNSPRMKRLLRARAKPSINMSNINATELMGFEIPLPSLATQRKVADTIDQVERVRAHHRLALTKLDELVDSVQQGILTGQQVVRSEEVGE